VRRLHHPQNVLAQSAECQRYPVAEIHGLFDVMGDEHHITCSARQIRTNCVLQSLTLMRERLQDEYVRIWRAEQG
jgi:hypothetical protein